MSSFVFAEGGLAVFLGRDPGH